MAIHCHAGLGRTGMLIACYLVFSERMTAKEAIYYVREKRPGAVQMNQQIEAIKEFEAFLRPARVVFFLEKTTNSLLTNHALGSTLVSQTSSGLSFISKHEQPAGTEIAAAIAFNLETFLRRQKLILHGKEAKKLKYIPKIVYVCGTQLKKLSYSSSSKDEVVNALLDDPVGPKSKGTWKKIQEYQLLLNESKDAFHILKEEDSPTVIAGLLWSWLHHLKVKFLQNTNLFY